MLDSPGMRSFLLRRLGGLVFSLLAASAAIFLLVRAVPGDPARLLLKNPTPESMAAVRERLGLDRPLVVQYFLFLKSVVLHGDFGESVVTGRDVRDDLARTWPATMELAVAAMVVATAAGLWLGVFSAKNAGTWRDALGTTVSLIGLSVPVFWLALLAILLFSLKLGWFPPGDRMSLTGEASWADQLRHLVLPALVLATIPMAFVARVTRSALLETFHLDFIRTARAKGASERAVLYRHALRAALGPIVTMIGIEFAYLLGGAVLTETVFAWPGIGRYIATAVLTRDYPAIQGSLLVLVALVMAFNLAADLAHYLLDPKLRR